MDSNQWAFFCTFVIIQVALMRRELKKSLCKVQKHGKSSTFGLVHLCTWTRSEGEKRTHEALHHSVYFVVVVFIVVQSLHFILQWGNTSDLARRGVSFQVCAFTLEFRLSTWLSLHGSVEAMSVPPAAIYVLGKEKAIRRMSTRGEKQNQKLGCNCTIWVIS